MGKCVVGWTEEGSDVIGTVISTPMGKCFRREIGDMAEGSLL